MKLQELRDGAGIIVQIAWEKNKLEFRSCVMKVDVEEEEEAIYVTPYIRERRELELTVKPDQDYACHIFADDVNTGQRISWRNVILSTVKINGRTLYRITTLKFNNASRPDERRVHARTLEEKEGQIIDAHDRKQQVMVHDISDNGVSFYVNKDKPIKSDYLTLIFVDMVKGGELFNLEIKCRVVHTDHSRFGRIYYGCQVLDPSQEYLLYVFLHRMSKEKK